MVHLLPGAIVLAAYCIGAVPFGWLIARAKGVDIFQQGSGNIGATNVGRVLGRKLGAWVFALDFVKGVVPVAAAIGAQSLLSDGFWRDGWLEVAAGLAAFLGHCFPIYLRFRGGKGVATGVGVVATLLIGQPLPLLAAVLVFLVIVSATRTMSLASIVAALVLAAVQFLASHGDAAQPRTAFCLVAAGLVTLRHRGNLVRIWRGTESRLQESALMNQLPKTLHVLALGLWFGMSVFFTFVVALSLFNTFEGLAKRPAAERPEWFPLTTPFDQGDEHMNGAKEQGTRAAGRAVGPMFDWYFLLQGICGLVALTTALAWAKWGGMHRWRAGLLLIALTGVIVGWPLERWVAELRPERDAAVTQYLRQLEDPTAVDPSALAKLRETRATFGQWHGISIMVNLATIVAVTGAMALAACLPSSTRAKEDATAASP